MELPTDGILAFLDCETYIENGCLESRLFFKEIHSGSIYPWQSSGPVSRKRSVVLGELHRAKTRSTNNQNMDISIDRVLNRFRRNGYPNHFLHKTLRIFHNPKSRENEVSSNKSVLKVPFLGEDHKRKVLGVLRRTGLTEKIRICFTSGRSLKRILHPPKERKECSTACETCSSAKQKGRCFSKWAIYRISCSICDKIYIGETTRTVQSRLHEHFKRESSTVFNHFKESHPQHIVQHNIKWEVLHHNVRSWHKRTYLEAICISEVNSTALMNGCIGRKLSVCWCVCATTLLHFSFSFWTFSITTCIVKVAPQDPLTCLGDLD